MLRFILSVQRKLSNGLVTNDHYTVDARVPVLEACLLAGGFSEDDYEHHSLVDATFISNDEATPSPYDSAVDELLRVCQLRAPANDPIIGAVNAVLELRKPD